jgi:TolB protein
MVIRPGQDPLKFLKKIGMFMMALAVLAISLACLAVKSLSKFQAPVSIPGASAGLIAFVGDDGNIYTIDRDGKQRSALTKDANLNPAVGQEGLYYQYPAWAPDGQHLAFIRLSSGSSGPEVSLFVATPDGKKSINAFTSPDFQPFYLSWSPDGQTIACLGNAASGGLAQYLVDASGDESKLIGTGQPYYWDWSPDSQTLLVHIGGAYSDNPGAHLAFIKLDDSSARQELDLRPGPFEAPAWSPAGDALALAAQNETGDDELILAGLDGKARQVLARLNGPVDFAWSPKGTYLAYAVLDLEGSVPIVHLSVVDSTQPDLHHQVSQGELVGFFWSPDGSKIAFLSVERVGPATTLFQTVAQTTQSASLAVWVYDRESGETKVVANFVPTLSFQQILPFYSQYQRSATIWSPDSRSLVLAGIDPAGGNAIYTVGADGSQFQKIADGDLAFWSWK